MVMSTITVNGINPLLPILGDTQRFIFDPSVNLTTFGSDNQFVPTSLISAQTNYECRNNGLSGYRWVHLTGNANTYGDFSLQYFLSASSAGTTVFKVSESSSNIQVYLPIIFASSVNCASGASINGGNLNMNSNKIINLTAPTNPTDATTKQYVDTAVGGVLPTSVILVGNVTGSGSTGSPITTTVAVCPPSAITGYPSNTSTFLRGDGTWASSLTNGLSISGASLNMNSQKITNLLTPTASTDGSTRGYVDGSTITLTGDVTGTGTLSGSVSTTVTVCPPSAITGYPGSSNSFLRGDGSWSNVLGAYLGLEGITPNAPLQFGQGLVNRKIVFFQTANNDHQFDGIGVNSGVIRYQAESSSTDHVFYQAASSSSSTEIFRINATGIGVNVTPHAPIHLNSATSNKKIVLNEVSFDNHQFWGFGQNSNELRYQAYASGSHAFYASTSSSTSNLLAILKSNGYFGLQGANPNAPLQFLSGISNRKIVLSETANNDHQVLSFGVGSGFVRYQSDASTTNHAFYSGINSTSSLEVFRILGTGGADAKNFKIVNLATPAASTDAATMGYVDTQVAAVATSVTLIGGVTGSGTTGSSITTTVAVCPPSAITGYPSSSSSLLRGDGTWTNVLGGNLGLGGITTPPVRFAITGPDSIYSNGPHIQATTAADAYPLFQILNYTHNNISLNFDSYYNGSSWTSGYSGSNFQICKTSNELQFNYGSGVAQGSTITWSNALVMNTSGQVGIGTSGPHAPLQFSNTYANRLIVLNEGANNNFQFGGFGTSSSGTLYFVNGNNSSNAHIFYAGASTSTVSELMRIRGDGFVGIETTAPDQNLTVNGNASKATGGSSWATFSDKRLKKIHGEYTHGLAEVLQLNPVCFSYNKKSGINKKYFGTEEVGLIAQEIENIIPECIEIKKTHLFEDTRIMKSSALTYMLINAVKELNQRIVTLEKAA